MRTPTSNPLTSDDSDATDRALQVRAAVASTLVAGLELAREGILSLRQAEDFGIVMMQRAGEEGT